ncbi:hypothetical protein GUITHDRAFT_114110 [Guillardia theta CCMP2712]|uniref:Uncharacterized protein n=1 Tax=Guillardia theta (strain CCMP2712) TaxID=905079 RepID=L1I4S0_GUITC|nr:hypothetical protein GUITHDRAFT_122551 [Guillardia theta CCMP2712]XP_005826842.1 hypothetical protein GUITHDRAFT_114110 [Guillardia theta CCMP2712]EKX31241.1 hypothetical protein GUITHDRAFT_122551 [Guillardia theta CCMP2712]EKX39862.1 hypothetical protein GUITHDRAFT_114110 [Guillardia theta CCMP2712]|eukprot:XP_005818221.1 hypothetical protein GUITHDRAFT_122551 [Guillardia theta CCMP2712]
MLAAEDLLCLSDEFPPDIEEFASVDAIQRKRRKISTNRNTASKCEQRCGGSECLSDEFPADIEEFASVDAIQWKRRKISTDRNTASKCEQRRGGSECLSDEFPTDIEEFASVEFASGNPFVV